MSAPYVMANAIRVRNFAQQGIEDLEALAKEYALSTDARDGDKVRFMLASQIAKEMDQWVLIRARAAMSGNMLVPLRDEECKALLAIERGAFATEWRGQVKKELGEGKE